MEVLQMLLAGLTAVVLFIFGLENFSTEIERISGERFRRFLSRVTSVPVLGVAMGAVVTAVIQSSSATSVIAISLVDAGVLSFRNSVGIIFGSNVGTTVTAQLVAFELTAFAPALILIGFLLSLVRSRVSIFGKSVFYFGFVFFTLELISSSLAPLQHEPALVEFLGRPHSPLLALMAGALLTALVQSSSVTTGLAIVFTQQGLLSLENAVPIIMGANVGTTATALIAMVSMDLAAKKAAMSHFLFNVGGVLLFLPLLLIFGGRLAEVEAPPAIALANIHLAFNVATSALFLVFLGPFTRLVDAMMGEGRMDFERLDIPASVEEGSFDSIRGELQAGLGRLLAFLQENYSLVTLSIESNYRSVFDASAKRIGYVGFIEREYMDWFSRVVARVSDETESSELLALITRYDYLFQIHDSIDDLFNAKRVLNTQYVELKSDVLMMVRELSSQTLALFEAVRESLESGELDRVRMLDAELEALLAEVTRKLLPLLAHPDRRDAGALSNFVTYSRRLADKLVSFAKLAQSHAAPAAGSHPA